MCRVLSISRTSTADDLKTVGALNDPNWVRRYGGKESGAGSEEDIDGGNGSGYIAQITLDRTDIPTEVGTGHLRPGMAVTAGIVTGKRRVISYVLSPIQRYVQDAGRER